MKNFLILLILFVSCTNKVPKKDIKWYIVVDTWKEKPLNVHQEISPRYGALLDSGDTIVCSSNITVGDTVKTYGTK